jgi:hypothetical protein
MRMPGRGLDRVAQRCLDGLDAGEPVGLPPKARQLGRLGVLRVAEAVVEVHAADRGRRAFPWPAFRRS